MNMRTESEIKAYVDGYNAAYKQFRQCFHGRKNYIEAMKKMEVFVAAVNAVLGEEGEDDG